MFAQLVITLVTVWIIAEVLCRWILKSSVAAAVRDLFAPVIETERPSAPTTPRLIEPHATLKQLLADRRRKLADTGTRLELTAEAAEVSAQLARREAELVVTEERLAEIEHRRSGNARD
jgi:hypothetical protein